MPRVPWRRLKRVLLRAVKRVGGFEYLLDSAWRRKRLLILCYHGVSLADEHEWNPGLYLAPEELQSRLALLRDTRSAVLPLNEAVDRLYAGTLPKRSVVLTFDDGYVDFAERAYPLLRKFDMPATVYLTTLRCEHPRPIFRLICSYMLWKARGRTIDATTLIGTPTMFDLNDARTRNDALNAVVDLAATEQLDLDGTDGLAARLGCLLGVDYEDLARRRVLTIMTPGEVADLSAAGVDFQLHTHTHETPRDPARFAREIVRNREVIEGITQHRATHFCYPSGVYHPEFLPWLSEQHVVSATTCNPGMASGRTHPLLLPRFVDVTGVPPVEFEGWISGAASLISRNRFHADVAY
jgi:peptidoglycan/xylan/chitin deacetylase (PgdA/CDA1 family)